jgi:hypothetical protein
MASAGFNVGDERMQKYDNQQQVKCSAPKTE